MFWLLFLLFYAPTPPEKETTDCIRITCLDPRDTVSSQEDWIATRFLIESTKDTLFINSIKSSCGCEAPKFNYEEDGIIFPGKPAIVTIKSDVKNRTGNWNKGHTINTSQCSLHFFTKWVLQ